MNKKFCNTINFKYLIYLMLFCAAIGIRLGLFEYQSTDYTGFLFHWLYAYRTYGGFEALKYQIGNYNIPYQYFLAFFSYLNHFDLYLIKALSCAFDILLAFCSYKIVKLQTNNTDYSIISSLIVFFLPTVISNSALWGQCDSIYVSIGLLGIYFALSDNPVLSMVCMAISFGFKLQATFILPICVLLLIMNKYKLWHFLIFPISYFVLILPSVLLGRPLGEALFNYLYLMNTAGTESNLNAPSFNAITGLSGSTVSAFLAMSIIIIIALVYRKRLNSRLLLILSYIMVTIIPFLLPHMHERYFYCSDILSVILIFSLLPNTGPKIIFSAIAAIFQQIGSLICYYYYFCCNYPILGSITITNAHAAILILISILIYIVLFICELKASHSVEQ